MAILGELRCISSEIHCVWCHKELRDPSHDVPRCDVEQAEASAEMDAALAAMTPEERAEWERSA